MKFIIVLNAVFLALCSHLVLASYHRPPLPDARDDNVDVSDNTTVATSFGNIVRSVLDDDKKKIEFSEVDGALEVTAIETEDGTATFYDAEDKEVNLQGLDEDDDSLEKHVSKWRLAITPLAESVMRKRLFPHSTMPFGNSASRIRPRILADGGVLEASSLQMMDEPGVLVTVGVEKLPATTA